LKIVLAYLETKCYNSHGFGVYRRLHIGEIMSKCCPGGFDPLEVQSLKDQLAHSLHDNGNLQTKIHLMEYKLKKQEEKLAHLEKQNSKDQ
jgi:hypothetical protein